MHFVCLIMFGNSEIRKFCGQIATTDEIFDCLICLSTAIQWIWECRWWFCAATAHTQQHLKWPFSKGTLFTPYEFNCVQLKYAIVVSYLHDIPSQSLSIYLPLFLSHSQKLFFFSSKSECNRQCSFEAYGKPWVWSTLMHDRNSKVNQLKISLETTFYFKKYRITTDTYFPDFGFYSKALFN